MPFKDDVLAVFKRVHDVSWPVFCNDCKNGDNGSDFWHTANTLDTCVDFILEGSRVWKSDIQAQRQQVQTMIQDSHKYFRRIYSQENEHGEQSPVVWWDDYGWWGITFTKIYQHFSEIFQGAPAPGVSRAECLQVARDCWTVMGSYSQDVNRTAKTPIPGGCWNHPPDNNGIQNSVTNGLFLVLCARLFQSTKDPVFLEATANQYLWFRKWYVAYPMPQVGCPNPADPQKGLFRCLENSGVGRPRFSLVYERAHVPNNPYNQGLPPFFNGQLWTGDQGLFLGGMAAVLALTTQLKRLDIIKNNDPEFPVTADNMALWVANGISWLFDTSHVLHDAPMNENMIVDFAADYATGKGVMMRYVPAALKSLGLDPRTYVIQSANAILASRSKADGQVAFRWNDKTDSKIGTNESHVIDVWSHPPSGKKPDKRFLPTAQSAGLDALNMAIPYLGQ